MPASWRNTDATLALTQNARQHQTEGRVVGHIFTTWSNRQDHWAEFESLVKGLELLQEPSLDAPASK